MERFHILGKAMDRHTQQSITAQTGLEPSLSPERPTERDVKDILHTNSVMLLLKGVLKNALYQGHSTGKPH